jgi:hypothetical protein
MKKIIKWVLAVVIIASCQVNVVADIQKMNAEKQEEFLALLEYEIQNRAFALMSLKAISKIETDPFKNEFWDLYLSLEVLNQKKYQPVATKYNLDQKPNCLAQLKYYLLLSANKWFSSYVMDVMHSAANKYVVKLKRMEKLASDDERLFFSYVVEQEKVQLDAIGLMREGRSKDAVNLLSDFVKFNNKE